MKLFKKYNRINIIATVLVFLLASIAFFFLIRYIIFDQLDDDLLIERNEIVVYAEKNHRLPEVIQSHDQQTEYIPAEIPPAHNAPSFTTHRIYSRRDKEDHIFREISFDVQVADAWWHVKVRKSLEGTDELVRSMLIITVCAVLLILVFTFFINRVILKKLWQPFYTSLDAVKNFSFGNKEKIQPAVTGIEEFDLMNDTLSYALNKASNDYNLLKEFTENAAHELQTPLAVIQAKLDMLIQDEHLTSSQSAVAEEAYDAIQKLSKLNQSLLLLARIENRQFSETESINLKEKLELKLKQLQDVYSNRPVEIRSQLSETNITMHPLLADILINNLLSNAIRYNTEQGIIEIELQHRIFSVCNTGMPCSLDIEKMYNRFYKQTKHNEGNGLGLSIVKQICDVSGFEISYNFTEPNMHCFTIKL